MNESGGNPRRGADTPQTHAYGGDEAKAYVPPPAINQKTKPADHGGAKNQLEEEGQAADAEPRVTSGTSPMQPVPPEVQQHARAAGPASATPPQGVAPLADSALPFQSQTPAVAPPPHVTPAHQPPAVAPEPVAEAPAHMAQHQGAAQADPVHGVVAPFELRPKQPPGQLTSPGVLTGAAGAPLVVREALARARDAAPAVSVPPQAAASAAAPLQAGAPPAGEAPAAPPGAYAGADVLPPQPHHPPPGAHPGYPPAPQPQHEQGAGAEPGHGQAVSAAQPPTDEHPLAATNSPWSQEKRLDAEILPSASVLAPPEEEVAAPPAVPEESDSGVSRTAMTVGLVVAAVALIATIVYFTVTDTSKSDDPADVKVGTEQRDYGDEPVPSVTATVEAPKPKPKPVYRPPPPPPPKPKKDDIYDGIE